MKEKREIQPMKDKGKIKNHWIMFLVIFGVIFSLYIDAYCYSEHCEAYIPETISVQLHKVGRWSISVHQRIVLWYSRQVVPMSASTSTFTNYKYISYLPQIQWQDLYKKLLAIQGRTFSRQILIKHDRVAEGSPAGATWEHVEGDEHQWLGVLEILHACDLRLPPWDSSTLLTYGLCGPLGDTTTDIPWVLYPRLNRVLHSIVLVLHRSTC